ncbi:MAG: pilus assembly protein [Firmicutes bacterium]|jgi:Flp pilus assembly protein TadG|nr:pilus assembly protein [Bacillota bacterium]
MKRAKDRKSLGQAMVELALIMPLLVFLLMAIATLGIAVNSKIAVTGAAREAAREYAIYQSVSRMRSRAEEFLIGSVTASEEDIAGHYTVTHRVDGDYVTVTVTYEQPVYVPGLMVLLGGGWMSDRMPLTSSATFKIEPN